ncbi:unnamed protein product [Brassica rapa subsp. narinosa]
MAMTVAASTSVAVSPPSLTFLRYLLALLADHLSPLKLVSGNRFIFPQSLFPGLTQSENSRQIFFVLAFAFCFFFFSVMVCSGMILAFPCNQEEPGTTDPITDFVCTRFKSEFPIFHKVQTARQILYKFYVL